MEACTFSDKSFLVHKLMSSSVLYDGCMGYEQVHGGYIAVGFCGEEELKILQGVPVLSDSLKGTVDKLNKLSTRIKFGFRFGQTV